MADPTWRTDNQLHDMAYALGRKILQMYDEAGIAFDVPIWPGGAPSADTGDTIVQFVVKDAEDFMTLDPQRIMDSYFTLQGMATATADKESEAWSNVTIAEGKLISNWHGAAAIEFARQMGYIKGFMEKQQDYYLHAVQAHGIAFSLSVQIRESFINLADNTMAACQSVIDEEIKKDAEAQISLGADIVQAGIEVASGEKIKDFIKAGAEFMLERTKSASTAALDTSGAPQVVESYMLARDRLRQSYENGLYQLRDWLNKQVSEVDGNSLGILEPLPVVCDIDGPNFNYGEFYNDNHDPGGFGPRVEQERQKYLQEKQQQQPPGVIGRRLDGDGE